MSFWTGNYWTANFWTSSFWSGASVVVTAISSGTAANVDEGVIVSSGGYVDIDLVGDTFIAAGTGPIGTIAESAAFVAAFTAATSPTNGLNNLVRDALDHTDLTRVSDTKARLTIPATAAYDPGARETISPVAQAAILTISSTDIDATSFFIKIASDAGGSSRGLSGGFSN